jgi:hypothetical protein
VPEAGQSAFQTSGISDGVKMQERVDTPPPEGGGVSKIADPRLRVLPALLQSGEPQTHRIHHRDYRDPDGVCDSEIVAVAGGELPPTEGLARSGACSMRSHRLSKIWMPSRSFALPRNWEAFSIPVSSGASQAPKGAQKPQLNR